MFHRIVMSLCVLSVVFFVVGPAAASTLVSEPYSGSQWYVTPLGVPGSASMSVATGINSNGQVVGYYGNGVSTSTALDEINNNRTADGSAGTFLWRRRHAQRPADNDQRQRHERGHQRVGRLRDQHKRDDRGQRRLHRSDHASPHRSGRRLQRRPVAEPRHRGQRQRDQRQRPDNRRWWI